MINAEDFRQYGKKALQAAVDSCAEAGGGEVFVPAGEWLSGPIHLKSNIRLRLDERAVVSFSDDPDDYLPPVFTRWEGIECFNYSPLIYADGCENIAVCGKGKLRGNGESWWSWKKLQHPAAEELYRMSLAGVPVEERVFATKEAALRPSFIQTINCKNVLLEDFTIEDGPQWTLHPVYCEDVTVRNVTVHTTGPNTDGLNPDSCRRVLIENCRFSTGDDCIAVNSGLNEDGMRVGRPCEDIEIRGCRMTGGHGAIVIGSAMSGGVRNVRVYDCSIENTMQGIRLKSMRGRGGRVEDVLVERININDVTDRAVQVNMFYEYSTIQPASDTPPEFENITIRDIKGRNNIGGIQLRGLPEKHLRGITLENISLGAADALLCENVDNVTLKNITISEEE